MRQTPDMQKVQWLIDCVRVLKNGKYPVITFLGADLDRFRNSAFMASKQGLTIVAHAGPQGLSIPDVAPNGTRDWHRGIEPVDVVAFLEKTTPQGIRRRIKTEVLLLACKTGNSKLLPVSFGRALSDGLGTTVTAGSSNVTPSGQLSGPDPFTSQNLLDGPHWRVFYTTGYSTAVRFPDLDPARFERLNAPADGHNFEKPAVTPIGPNDLTQFRLPKQLVAGI